MIGWTLAAVLYVGVTCVLAIALNGTLDSWWKSLGAVLLLEVGGVVLYILVAVMCVALERGI